MSNRALGILVILIPLCAVLFERHLVTPMAERHHNDHDMYAVSSTLTRSMVATMVFMGSLGIILAWLCTIGVFSAYVTVVLAFFEAFLTVAFVIWICIHRYQVVTFDDHMCVTSFVGRSRTIAYADIERMVWARPNAFAGYRSVRVYARGHSSPVLIWGALDIEHILLCINRFDVLEGPKPY